MTRACTAPVRGHSDLRAMAKCPLCGSRAVTASNGSITLPKDAPSEMLRSRAALPRIRVPSNLSLPDDHESLLAIATSVLTPPEVLADLTDHEHTGVVSAACTNPATPTDAMWRAFKRFTPGVKTALLMNPKAPERIVASIAREALREVREGNTGAMPALEAVAAHVALSDPDLLVESFRAGSLAVRAAVVGRQELPEGVARFIAAFGESPHRFTAVLRHFSAPMLEEVLTSSSDSELIAAALCNDRLSEHHITATRIEELAEIGLTGVARRASGLSEEATKALLARSRQLRARGTDRNYTANQVLASIAQLTPYESVIVEIAQDPSFGLGRGYEGCMIFGNRHCPDKIAIDFARHGHSVGELDELLRSPFAPDEAFEILYRRRGSLANATDWVESRRQSRLEARFANIRGEALRTIGEMEWWNLSPDDPAVQGVVALFGRL